MIKQPSTRQRLQLRAVFCALLLPALAFGFATARQELSAALHSKPDFGHGAELFRKCAICHGPKGGGTLDGGVPRIAGQHISVLAKQLVDYRHDRRWDIRMEHFADRHHLADAQAIADVTAYVHQLEVEVPPGVGDGELVAHGESVYRRQCQSCHGESAEGNSKTMVPRLAGQHYEYLMRQIYDAADGRRPNFSPVHTRLLARLERADITGLADFLARMEFRGHPAEPVPASTGSAN
jgi:cytochrome c553